MRLLLGCLCWLSLSVAANPAVPVIVAEIKLANFSDEVEALGTLRANESVDLASPVTELVTGVFFEDSARVKKGDVLVTLDSAEEKAELSEQRSFLREAQQQVNRLGPLVKRGAAIASALDENKRNASAAKARIEAIQSRIDQRTIKAPYDGILGFRNISVGTLAQQGSMITTIDDDSIMKLDFSISEIFLSTLEPGLSIEAKTEAYPDQTFEAKISSVNSRVDPVTRSIQIRALIDNPNGQLKPGLLMKVVLHKRPRQALLVPEEAIVANGSNNYVYVVREEADQARAERRQVQLGTRTFGNVEVTSGIEENELVVVHGTMRMSPGALVNITAVERDNEPLETLLNQKSSAK